MKKISRLFPLILCTVSVHAAPQWSCPRCTVDQIKPIFEKYATGDALIKMLNTFDRNLNNGILNARGFARTCHAAGLKGSVGTEGYKKCESFVLEMANLATPLKTKAGTSSAKMSECEASVRADLIDKETGAVSAGSIVDALKKNCGFDDTDSYLFKGVRVSGGQAMSLAGLLGRKQCRVDQLHGILVCEDKYAYIFDGLDNNDKLTTERANNIAKGVCAVDVKTSANNRDMMSFDDSIKGCPTPQVVANCQEFQKQLQRINPSLVAKEQKEYSQNYCVVSVKKQQAKSVTQIDFEDGVEIVANCKPKEINTNVFAGSSVTPMQAIAMANRYLLKQCHKYQCGEWPEGNGVKCGAHEFRFSSINNSNQGKVSNHSISKVFCEIYGGSYTSMTDDYGLCGVSSSVCSGGLRADVQGIVNNSIAVNYEAGQCVLSWGPRPNWANVDQSFGDGDVFDPDSWMSKPDDENNMQSVMEIQEPKNGRLADQVPVKKPAQTPAKVEAPKPAETAPKAEDKKLDVNKGATQKEAFKPAGNTSGSTKAELAKKIEKIVVGLLPNDNWCENAGESCGFQANFVNTTEGQSAVGRLKQDLSGVGCRLSTEQNGCEKEQNKECWVLAWQCPDNMKVSGTVYMRKNDQPVQKTEKVRLTNDPCDGLDESTMQTLCDKYNNTLKQVPMQRGTTYSLESSAYGKCYKKYGYELDLAGCRKKK